MRGRKSRPSAIRWQYRSEMATSDSREVTMSKATHDGDFEVIVRIVVESTRQTWVPPYQEAEILEKGEGLAGAEGA